MQPNYLQVFRLPSGKFKVMVFGNADGHMMDWAGCNYRITPVTGQPRRGFETKAQAFALFDSIDEARKQEEFSRAYGVVGMFLGDSSKYHFVDR